MDVRSWRKSKGWRLEDLGIQLGLQSKGRVSRLERGVERWPTDLAITVDRISLGEVPVATLRPDLHDVRVVRAPADSRVSA